VQSHWVRADDSLARSIKLSKSRSNSCCYQTANVSITRLAQLMARVKKKEGQFGLVDVVELKG